MAWERRRGGREYYYRSMRCGTKVTKVYMGAGEKGRQAAEADQTAGEFRQQAARLREEESRPVDDLAADLDEFDKLVDQLVTCQLLVSGAKKHRRQWRLPSNGRVRNRHRVA